MTKSKPSRWKKCQLSSFSALAGSSAGWFTLTLTRSPAQKPACKDLGRNGQKAAITPKAAYTPVSTRAGSRS
ncbi:hypothetical protein CPZ20_04705 [Lacticaseibacillus rhamnosus]|uniref:Alpha-galactosidase n=1 Tax=Lacticaseibacillus rhamnosus TaxID=47715 RepID=A0AAX0K1T5_LACRH|nr:hypothetical protein [Lacticaseibacillus rhamnosus]MCI9805477.1 hypothetical protein [Lacticaseibacillus rhamnosus]MCI9808673.1 hypothetical protein [Lacticaseibacillus rhamnosus]ONN74730.1 hypothetical protein BWR10_07615 [Lacticaseibacillus rhamnosus]PCL29739.1 hypothetical protein CPZ20_04705 [Lacticaseibacillus rhamnosus]